MERERQILQYFNRWDKDDIIKFAPNSEMIEVLNLREFTETIAVPGRREGSWHTREVVVRKLAGVAWFNSLDEYAAASKKPTHHKEMADAWTIEEMPDEVQAAYEAWIKDDVVPKEAELRRVFHEIALEPTDRMTEMGDCLHCPNDEQYECYTSGRSRQLYRYPLVRVRAEHSRQVYEVPLDSALLVDHHPDSLIYSAQPTFSQHGQMHAGLNAEINVTAVSSDYIHVATNGKISPQEENFEVLNGARFKIRIAEWSEEGGQVVTYKDDLRSLASEFQDAIMMANVERVTGVNYNTVLTDIKHRLGKHGLALALDNTIEFHEPTSKFMALTDSNTKCLIETEDSDIYRSLEKMDERTKKL